MHPKGSIDYNDKLGLLLESAGMPPQRLTTFQLWLGSQTDDAQSVVKKGVLKS